MNMPLPTINASDLDKIASEFAEYLTDQLEEFNSKHPISEFREKENKYLNKLTPKKFVPVFEQLFYLYVASRRVVIPNHD